MSAGRHYELGSSHRAHVNTASRHDTYLGSSGNRKGAVTLNDSEDELVKDTASTPHSFLSEPRNKHGIAVTTEYQVTEEGGASGEGSEKGNRNAAKF